MDWDAGRRQRVASRSLSATIHMVSSALDDDPLLSDLKLELTQARACVRSDPRLPTWESKCYRLTQG